MSKTSNEAKTMISYPEEFAKIRDAVFDEAAAMLGYARKEMDDIAHAMEIADAMNEMTLVAICRRAMGDGPPGRATFNRWTYLVADDVARSSCPARIRSRQRDGQTGTKRRPRLTPHTKGR